MRGDNPAVAVGTLDGRNAHASAVRLPVIIKRSALAVAVFGGDEQRL